MYGSEIWTAFHFNQMICVDSIASRTRECMYTEGCKAELLRQRCHNNKRFSELALHHDGHRYGTKKITSLPSHAFLLHVVFYYQFCVLEPESRYSNNGVSLSSVFRSRVKTPPNHNATGQNALKPKRPLHE